MTKQEREDIIRKFWEKNQGLLGATAGAKALSAESGIPVNTIRGTQNKMYAPDARPWNLPPRAQEEVLHTCPTCGKKAHTDAEVEESFGYRKVWRGKKDDRYQIRVVQSYCRACKVAARRKSRAAARAQARAEKRTAARAQANEDYAALRDQALAKAEESVDPSLRPWKIRVVESATGDVHATMAYPTEEARDTASDALATNLQEGLVLRLNSTPET